MVSPNWLIPNMKGDSPYTFNITEALKLVNKNLVSVYDFTFKNVKKT